MPILQMGNGKLDLTKVHEAELRCLNSTYVQGFDPENPTDIRMVNSISKEKKQYMK